MCWTTTFSPEQWSAAGSWLQALAAVGTLITAGWALAYARRQVAEARSLREEQAKPFVTVSIEPSHGVIANLVIRNQGLTLARNVRFTFSPEYASAFPLPVDPTKSRIWTSGLPTIVPGQEFRMLIDRFPDRASSKDLPRAYDVTVSYENAKGELQDPLCYVLDFDAFYGYGNARVNGIHEAVNELQAISRVLNSVQRGGRLVVHAIDGMHDQETELDEHNYQLSTWQQFERKTGRGPWGARTRAGHARVAGQRRVTTSRQ